MQSRKNESRTVVRAALGLGALALTMLTIFPVSSEQGTMSHESKNESSALEAQAPASTEKDKETVTGLIKSYGESNATLFGILEDHRPDLHRYCLRLTGSPWDAEDLVQESLARACKMMGESHFGIEAPRAYIFRMATNLWIDHLRRYRPEALGDDMAEAKSEDLPELKDEVRSAMEKVCANLVGRERACFLLADIFSFKHDEVATLLGTSTGAVKVAVHRARKKLEKAKEVKPKDTPALNPSSDLVDAFVAAFNKRDLKALVGLMAERGETEILGMVDGLGQRVNKVIQENTLPDPRLLRAEKKVYRGETVILLWYKATNGEGEEKEVVRDIVRLEGEGKICTRLRFYYFAADTLKAVCAELGIECLDNGYHF